ncbi:unnamed protein product [Darwinula stevensoni]|uniref:EMI domain-containing protein n=1 Tax=Darwinula stevensoni TaxID=69355 RepID=A0A7R9A956_9CRUS|nr:unnamed protein product [Darwinula stevensoni]CAG0897035.1 unnamed protein product [Darwinula stevensoni]
MQRNRAIRVGQVFLLLLLGGPWGCSGYGQLSDHAIQLGQEQGDGINTPGTPRTQLSRSPTMHLTALLPLALSLGLVLGEFCEPRSSSRRRRSHTQQRSATRKLPWWYKRLQKEGPNACVVEEVPGTDRRFYTECRYWMNRQICGQKTVLRYECCEGFERIEGRKGCTKGQNFAFLRLEEI